MFSKILVPLDRSNLAEQALGRAAAIARASHAAIDVVLVHEPLPASAWTDLPSNAAMWDDEHKYLETVAGELTTGAAIPSTHAMLRGDPVEMICLRARDVGADLIVMTSHGRTGLSRAWIGSVADGLLKHSSLPVLMLRPVEGKTRHAAAKHLFKDILVPLDGSGFSEDVIDSAVALAQASGAALTLLRVVLPVPLIVPDVTTGYASMPILQDDPATERLVAEAKDEVAAVARRLEPHSLNVQTEVVVAPSVARGILEVADNGRVDAIAMSTHGRGISRLFVGSVADKVLRGTRLPILLHRPAGVRTATFLAGDQTESQMPAVAKA